MNSMLLASASTSARRPGTTHAAGTTAAAVPEPSRALPPPTTLLQPDFAALADLSLSPPRLPGPLLPRTAAATTDLPQLLLATGYHGDNHEYGEKKEEDEADRGSDEYAQAYAMTRNSNDPHGRGSRQYHFSQPSPNSSLPPPPPPPPRAAASSRRPEPRPGAAVSTPPVASPSLPLSLRPVPAAALRLPLLSSPPPVRTHKIAATDVASVGNASDTLVPLTAPLLPLAARGPEAGPPLDRATVSPPSPYLAPRTQQAPMAGNTAPQRRLVSPPRHCSGRDLHESAKACLNAGQLQAALDAFEAIVAAQTARFGTTQHCSVGAALHNVGVCQQRMQRYLEAEASLAEAVRIRLETLGPDHLEVAASLSKLGAARAALRKFDDAFEDILQAIRIARDQLGREHKTVAQLYCHLGCFYYEAGECFAAQATFMEAYDIYRAAWSSVADRDGLIQQMCDTLGNIGSLQNRRRRYADAILTFTEALELQQSRLSLSPATATGGPGHLRILATLDNLGYSYSKSKDYARALNCYRTMLQTLIAADRTVFPEAALDALRKLVLMYEKLRKGTDALRAAQDTLLIARSRLPQGEEKLTAQLEALIAELERKVQKTQP